MKKKILIFISHYLPGYKIGGPLNSVLHITESLNEHYNFYILTSDRDLGDKSPFPNLPFNKWLDTNSSKVMYCESGFKYYLFIYRHLKKNDYDILYLNSFFDFKFSIYIIILNYLNFIKINKIIVAPRGELIKEALNFGKIKKYFYLGIINMLKVYRNVTWHSTAQIETISLQERIIRPKIKFARVLADSSSSFYKINDIDFFTKSHKFLKIIFLSRISKEKNLIYALRVLKELTCPIEFHIYGPIEDPDIWNECLHEIQLLTSNVHVSYRGPVRNELVKSYFAKYDLFFFPSHIENYGHVINESLSVGTPVLLSDNTPWRNLQNTGLGWDFNLSEKQNFINTIFLYSQKSITEKLEFRKEVLKSYSNYIDYPSILIENIELFK